jgi:DNA-cytosine methyltransferase
MKYMSLFSGIGGFEIAIQNIFPNAVCVGFSEVDKHAIAVYKHHFPTHENMGSVTDITEKQIKKIIQNNGGIDLIIGGFPCQNLSSLARCFKYTNSDGLEGPKSSLFYSMIQVIKWIKKHNPVQLHLLAENNASMSSTNKKLITDTFEGVFEIPIYCTDLNGIDFGVQKRRRLYWTTWKVVSEGIKCEQTWDDVLEPIEKCKHILSDKHILGTCSKIYPKQNKFPLLPVKAHDNTWIFEESKIENSISKWQRGFNSDTRNQNSNPITRNLNMANSLIDRRIGNDKFIIRYFEPIEVERLFWIPEGWVSTRCSKSRCFKLLGNTVIIKVIEHILSYHNVK